MNQLSRYNCLPRKLILNSRYCIQKILAKSDLSIVYFAYDCSSNQKCVVKEFFPRRFVLRDIDRQTVILKKPSLKQQLLKAQELFFNEALLLKTLRHCNINKYLDHFTANHTGYLVTAFYKGPTLDQYIKSEKQISKRDILINIFIPILNVVAELHKIGIIHRDLKPNNIIITKRNVPVLIDFGSAIYFQKSDKKRIFVTPGFSPLEFYAKNSRQGPFSDIYSLAAMLYYYICGKVPVEVIQRVFEDNLEDLRQYHEAISPWLARVIMKCLAVDSQKRYKSLKCLKLLLYLEAWLAGKS
jgi:serine/threonine protein kinase